MDKYKTSAISKTQIITSGVLDLVKTVVKSREMPPEMFRDIERWAIECYEEPPKFKFKDEMVKLHIIQYRK